MNITISIAFFAGLISFLSPCVLPLIPGYISYISGTSLEDKKKFIPAVTHIDGTGRVQTVSKSLNHNFYSLINKFYNISGVPILLNTSFNENEPIVNKPSEAIECFLRTKMDVLVIGKYLIKR